MLPHKILHLSKRKEFKIINYNIEEKKERKQGIFKHLKKISI